jgi:DNA-binding XRE family transcriptional regulator
MGGASSVSPWSLMVPHSDPMTGFPIRGLFPLDHASDYRYIESMETHTHTPTGGHAYVGQTITRIREELGISKAELGRRMGLPRQAMFMLEAGDRRLDVIELCRIADALGVAPVDLFAQVTKTDKGACGHQDDEELLATA